MSDHSHAPAHDAAHSGSDTKPKHALVTVFVSFLVPLLIIVGLVSYFTAALKPASYASNSEQAIAARIQKIGKVEMGGGSHEAKSGEDVFKGRCSACHGTGAMGSPKFGDAAAWGPRIGKGFDALLNSALHGKGNMPAQGGADLSDFEIGRGVVYMANAGGAKFAEPKAPAAAAPAAAPAAK